jgi:hypothetical protein
VATTYVVSSTWNSLPPPGPDTHQQILLTFLETGVLGQGPKLQEFHMSGLDIRPHMPNKETSSGEGQRKEVY